MDIIKIYNSNLKHVLSGICYEKYHRQDTYTECHLPQSIMNYYAKDKFSLDTP
jgi:hypothetical protein